MIPHSQRDEKKLFLNANYSKKFTILARFFPPIKRICDARDMKIEKEEKRNSGLKAYLT